ncbi:hypothetical protein HK097_008864 [Rhizophlyctis rosea]|uniref:Uncharacterized protein n=1 Tax=Rhizophlyctis rosea TaxID=64517 RepID=A0AAD5X501_9FUNG|nr:hypothetical protein HK097_008864 [Rhizophlyctis rosea]
MAEACFDRTGLHWEDGVFIARNSIGVGALEAALESLGSSALVTSKQDPHPVIEKVAFILLPVRSVWDHESRRLAYGAVACGRLAVHIIAYADDTDLDVSVESALRDLVGEGIYERVKSLCPLSHHFSPISDLYAESEVEDEDRENAIDDEMPPADDFEERLNGEALLPASHGAEVPPTPSQASTDTTIPSLPSTYPIFSLESDTDIADTNEPPAPTSLTHHLSATKIAYFAIFECSRKLHKEATLGYKRPENAPVGRLADMRTNAGGVWEDRIKEKLSEIGALHEKGGDETQSSRGPKVTTSQGLYDFLQQVESGKYIHALRIKPPASVNAKIFRWRQLGTIRPGVTTLEIEF